MPEGGGGESEANEYILFVTIGMGNGFSRSFNRKRLMRMYRWMGSHFHDWTD